MSKLLITDLKYIALEGGGASGVVYNGAIGELEDTLKKNYSLVEESNGALLDYVDAGSSCDIKDYIPKIKGVAGSSAGAINAFAIALGLSSKQIEEDIMQKVDFSIFLTEYDAGLYRMVGEDGELKVGKGRKPLGSKKAKFEFGKKTTKFSFGGNGRFVGKIISTSSRVLFLNIIMRVITSGIVSTVEDIFRLIGRRRDHSELNELGDVLLGESEENSNPATRGILNIVRMALSADSSGLSRNVYDERGTTPDNRNKGRFNILVSMLSTQLLLSVLRYCKLNPKKIKMKVNLRSISNLIWDRGLFSGFTVREYFMDLVVLSATRNTHFQRKLIEYSGDKSFVNDKDALSNFGKKFEFFYRKGKTKLDENEKRVINGKLIPFIEKMTFKQFYDITGVTFGVCVSNFSTDQPLYFSHEYTPDFIVIEAVAASMTIPPAIKPLYNEMNVVKPVSKYISVTVNNTDRDFTDNEGNFKNSDFYELQGIVKKYLQKIAIQKNQYIDLNNSIGSNSFLQLLREEAFKINTEKIVFKDDTEIEYKFCEDLFIFFYNAAYKGLLIDGGYRNNIPYNFFREKGFNNMGADLEKAQPNFLKEVIALKLDNSFPVEVKSIIYKKFEEIRSYYGKQDRFSKSMFKILMSLIRESHETDKSIELLIKEKIAEEPSELLYRTHGEKLKVQFKSIKEVIESVVPISKYERNKSKGITDKTIEGCLVKIAEMFAEHYLLENEHKPWSVNKNILMTTMEGYEFGTGDGQIRYMSDHNFIIPLYTYGVSTFDFDFKKELMPLVKLSQEKSRAAIDKYFNK